MKRIFAIGLLVLSLLIPSVGSFAEDYGNVNVLGTLDVAGVTTLADVKTLSPTVDVRAYASINAAVTAIGATPTTLLIPNAQTLTANATIPETLTLKVLQGGSIDCSTYTLVINGVLEAGLYQIFSNPSLETTSGTVVSGSYYSIRKFNTGDNFTNIGAPANVSGPVFQATGTTPTTWTNSSILRRVPVIFGNGSIEGIYPEWFGAKGDNSTDCTLALNQCSDAAAALRSFVQTRIIILSNGVYQVTATSGNYAVHLWCPMVGKGTNDSIIYNVGEGSALKINAPYFSRFENFKVQGNASSEDGIAIDPLYEAEVAQSTFSHVDSFSNGRNGIAVYRAWGTNYNDCKFNYNGSLGFYLVPEPNHVTVHNSIVCRDCNADHNGGLGDNTADYAKGGVRVSETTGFLWDGGTVQDNNAYGFIIGIGTDVITENVFINNVWMEQNPRVGSTSTVGSNIIVGNNYQRVEVNNSWMSYGADAGATGYCFYTIGSPAYYPGFSEWRNFTISDGRAGTATRDYGNIGIALGMDANGAFGTRYNYLDFTFNGESKAYVGFTSSAATDMDVENIAGGLKLQSSGAGGVAIGNFVPSASLQIRAGGTAAGTAPFMFTLSGAALNTTPQVGALEVDSTGNLYITNSSAVRKLISTDKHIRRTIIDPNATYGISPTICLIPVTDRAITITSIVVTTSSASYEVAGDLKYADAFIGLGTPTLINDFDTTSGVRTDTSITASTVPSGKCVYLSFDSAPSASMTQVSYDITYY